MAIQIKLKNSVVQDSTPSASDLPEVGELAVNGNINSIGGFMRASDNSIVKIFGPGSVTTPTATTTVSGIAELATSSETTTGTATNRVVTPAGLNAVTVAERTTSNTNYVAKAGSTLTGVLTMPNGSNSAPAINFGDSDSGIFGGTNTVSLTAGGTTRLTADTGVSVVGTLAVTGAITSTSDLTIPDKIIHSGDTNTAIRFPAADTVSVETGGSERARIDNGGKLLVGTPTARTNFFNLASTHTPRLQIESTNSDNGRAALGLIYGINNASGPYIAMAKHRSNSIGGQDVAQSNDETGIISFQASDGSQFVDAARISGFVDGTPGADDMPGRLVFSTTADGAAMPSTRLTIDSAGLSAFTGDVTIGTVSVSNAKLHIGDGSGDDFEGLRIINTHNDANAVDTSFIRLGITNVGGEKTTQIAAVQESNAGNAVALRFSTNSSGSNNGETEKMRLDSLGRLLLGTTDLGTASADNLTIADSGHCGITIRSGSSSGGNLFFTDANSGGDQFQGYVQYDHSDNSLGFGTQKIKRMSIDSIGNLLVGANSSVEVASGAEAQVQVTQSSDGSRLGLSLISVFDGSGPSAILALGHGRGSTSGLLQDNDLIGQIRFAGGDGTDMQTQGAAINAEINGTPSSNDMPTDLIFFTNSGTASVSERMRLDKNGRLMLGTTALGNTSGDDLTIATSGTTGITLRSGTSNNGNILFSDGTSGDAEIRGVVQYAHGDNSMRLFTNATERLRINTDGKVGIGSQVPNAQLVVYRPTVNASNPIFEARSNHDTTDSIKFSVDGDGEAYFSDNVGIGSTSPAAALTIAKQGTIISGTGNDYGFNINLISSGYVYLDNVTGAGNNTSMALRTYNNGTYTQFIQSISGNQTTFETAGSERMRIDSSGRVGIGHDTPGSFSSAAHTLVLNTNSGNCGITISTSAADQTGSIFFAEGTGSTGDGRIRYEHANNAMAFSTADTESMRLDSSARLLIGTTTQFGNGTDKLMIKKGNDGGRISFGTDAGFAECIVGQLNGYWGNNKKIAAISFFGGSDTTNKDDGNIRFATSSADNLAERMRITESGDVALGTTTPSARLHVFRNNDNQTACFIQNNGTTGGHGLKIRSGGTGTGTNLLNIESHVTGTAKTRLLLDASGRLRIGEDEISGTTYRTKISSETGQTYVLFLAEKATGGQGLGIATRIDGAGSSSTAIRFFDGPGAASVSTVTVTSTTVTYNTGSSDRTMKKNFENWTDSVLNSFKNLNPQKFNYLVEDDTDEKHKGFVAQDLVADFPEAYPKDTETDKYSFNPSGMVVYLMKAIQELEAKVAALEAA